MDAKLFLDDFEDEARAHIERIETAFLDVDALAGDPKKIDGVFRAAHSLKGTAGFFSLGKIVAVAHELESVFSQIKDGESAISEDVADIVLQSVDCLRDLLNNMHDDGVVDTKTLIETLKKNTNVEKPGKNTEKFHIPFDCKNRDTEDILKDAARRGHKTYYVNISFNKNLGKYYEHPEVMIDEILSIGSIVEAMVDVKAGYIIRDSNPAALTAKIATALSERDTSTLELLVTSVLELDLFSMAIEVDTTRILPMSGLQQEEAESKQIYKQAPARTESLSIRLNVSVINGLLDLANEMILTRNRLFSAVTGEKTNTGLIQILQDMNRLTSEIQQKVMLARMQPLSVIFDKFPRIIRDTARALDKDIGIEIFGSDVMLDKYLLDSLSDPISQIVKNSVDHGLEPSPRRAGLRKPQKGKVTLNAYMRDGSAIIEVADDGAGIDTEALLLKSIERGILTEEMISVMPKSDALALIFQPGISTAENVTNISGRGVGMDIVKTNIEKLGGSIEIDSEVDKGTTIRLKVPLTLSVIRALIVTINSVQYAVPEINVEYIVRIRGNEQSRRLERINESLFLYHNGRIIPVVTMEEMEAKSTSPGQQPAETQLKRSLSRDVIKILVLKAGGRSFALLIDDAIETVQTLVKPLPVYLQKCLCYSSVTVLGDGNAVMILDAPGIIRHMGIEAVEKSAPAEKVIDEDEDIKQVIVFKCSGAEYFALETHEVSRIEAVVPEHIQEIGDSHFINIADKTIRVVRPEDFAPVKKRGYAEKKLYMLTLKKSASPVGFLAGKVLDNVEAAFKLDGDQLYSDFIFGTSVFNEKILIFLNPGAIVSEVEKDKQGNKNVKKKVDVI